ncbi:MAG: PASTA domain-containing protein [Spirochaetes bacterium]|nr:PASTA domain-containing protein [Spirochaetota bacterium]
MKLSFDFRNIASGFRKLGELDRDSYKFAAIGFFGIVVLMTLSGLIAFFMSLRGEEQTLVPNVSGMELTTALIKLQEKELYPRIALRVTNRSEDKGRILEQRPPAGSIVKAGRRISLTVGKGVAVDKIENFIGMNIDEVKLHLQTVFSSARPLVTVREPPIYVYNAKARAGMVLEQKPPAGTDLAGPVALELIVSRGPEEAKMKVPAMLGLQLADAIVQIGNSGVPFSFQAREATGKEKPGTVVSQLPAAGVLVSRAQPVAIVWAFPLPAEGMASGLIRQTLPEYPYPLKVAVTAKYPTGESVKLAELLHSGGEFTIPYLVPDGSVISLAVLGRDILRFEAKSAP